MKLAVIVALLLSTFARASGGPPPDLYADKSRCAELSREEGFDPPRYVLTFDGLPTFRSNKSDLLYGLTTRERARTELNVQWIDFKGEYDGDHGVTAALACVNDLPATAHLLVIGYSWGGPAALRFAQETSRSIDSLFLLDPVTWKDGKDPQWVSPADRVRQTINVYEHNDWLFWFHGEVLAAADRVYNIRIPIDEDSRKNLETLIPGASSDDSLHVHAWPGHLSMPAHPLVQRLLDRNFQ